VRALVTVPKLAGRKPESHSKESRQQLTFGSSCTFLLFNGALRICPPGQSDKEIEKQVTGGWEAGGKHVNFTKQST
jgi:hypothetical protein